MQFTNNLMTWIPNAGAAGLVVTVVLIFLKEIKSNRESQVQEQKGLYDQRTSERAADFQHFKETLVDLRGEMKNARDDFKEQLTLQRNDFGMQLLKITQEFHERHENLQNQVVELVKDNNKVGIQMSTAITEVRDEIRTLKTPGV